MAAPVTSQQETDTADSSAQVEPGVHKGSWYKGRGLGLGWERRQGPGQAEVTGAQSLRDHLIGASGCTLSEVSLSSSPCSEHFANPIPPRSPQINAGPPSPGNHLLG